MNFIMAMADEQGMYKNTMDVMKQSASVFKEFMEALLAFFDKRAEFASARALARWIREGNGISMYTVRGDCREDVINALRKNGIPYQAQKGDTGSVVIMIRNKDTEQCADINQKILMAKSRYYQAVQMDKLEDAINDYDGFTHAEKKIVRLSGLNEDIANVIRNKSNDITRGFMVGFTQPDENGKCDVAVHSKLAMVRNEDKHDFCRAILAASLSLYGPNKDLKEKQLKADDKIRNDLARVSDEGNDTSYENVYVCGASDHNRFIEITDSDFQYYEMVKDENGNGRHEEMKFRCSKGDPNYNMELLKYCDVIQDKVIVKSMSELNAFMERRKSLISDRPEKDERQQIISDTESQLTTAIDRIVQRKTNRSQMSNKELQDPDTLVKRMKEYFAEVENVMAGLKNGTVPDGYLKEDMDYLNSIMTAGEVNIDDYQKSAEFMKSLDIDVHQAQSRAQIVYDRTNGPKKEPSREDNAR